MFTIAMLVQLGVFLSILTFVAYFLGEYMAKVFSGQRTWMSFILRPIENLCYRLFGVDENEEMNWKTYVVSFVVFNVIGIVVLFLLQLLQHLLPLNPQKLGSIRWDSALNTAVSFVTNTNWQSYVPESTMSYLTQMLGLAVQNFLSAAVGIAAVMAFIRGFIRKTTTDIGNFWVDTTRAVLYVLLPFAFVFSLVLVSQGVIQNFSPYVAAHTLEGNQQIIAQGPVASQLAIKMLGTNGGGFFNANSSHPYENPTPMTDYLEILGLLVITVALPFAFGALLGKRKQGWAIFAVMMTLYLAGLSIALWSEFHGNPLLTNLGVEHGLNMEGKEVRFGPLASVVFAHSTTVTSCGAVNTMHDSFMPITGLILLFNMFIGEVVFGGVGVGLIGILHYAILAMFLVGLMIGRTPEIFGKKLEPYEMVMAVIALIVPSIVQLGFAAIAVSTTFGLSSLNNAGPHGLSEILYAFGSAAGNNGSAFAGLNANTVFYNLVLAFTILVGRFGTIIPALAIAGSLVKKKNVPEVAQFPTASPLFVFILIGVIIIVGALTFFPVLVLGPFLEHLFISAGVTF
ncbi:MAG TPA: potassium-transporting ATPase subunit KdpA [Candidatus Margulisbacteria bacterium]|nr:MAG: potassium-transporting ATPase subunit KdpA [Candidatus Margulisbacteria bacterium GWD2_39_127]HAR63662.1 potassium-transporting ATPase subunit KdpA [Candidatus Margulisiibacteriota bacterium]